ncbi:MAG: 2OG-Fe(II) oxygenase, partial [Allosphingosinicella sp.]
GVSMGKTIGDFYNYEKKQPNMKVALGVKPRDFLDLFVERILNLAPITAEPMNDEPYRWAAIAGLFTAEDAARLASAFPRDKFRDVAGHDGEKGFQYAARSLIHMGASEASHARGLDPYWLALARDLLSSDYRDSLSAASGLDLSAADMEANVVHYGPGAWLGPHLDLKEKILTHIFYFNPSWDPAEGGCLNILASKDPDDRVAEIQPLVGNSSLLVRSERSWHSVSPVAPGCTTSRRSLNVIFHLPGSVSTMWPPRARIRLRDYTPE